MGLVNKKVIFKPLLKRIHRKKRYDFAKKFKRWTVNCWRKVVFSDEKVFRVIPGGQVKRWIPKNAKKFDAKYLGPAVSKPQGLMVWAAINGRGQLIVRRCPPKVKAVDYQAILDSALHFIRKRYFMCDVRSLTPSNLVTGQPTRYSSMMEPRYIKHGRLQRGC